MGRHVIWRCTDASAFRRRLLGTGLPGWAAAQVRSTRGQASVEAAAVLPATMLVFALLLQPVCLSYTRAVMCAAAAECARAAATSYGSSTAACKEMVLRRLEAVPPVALFHVGGRGDWQVRIDRGSKQVSVRIRGHARPLPLMGMLASAAMRRDATGLVLSVELTEDVRPSWLGGDYGAWQGMWG